MAEHVYWVYILASCRNGTLYVGFATDLDRRVREHREGLIPGFTSKYAVTMLVWFEEHQYLEEALERERSIKRWRRAWKLALIERGNPQWRDLWRNVAD